MLLFAWACSDVGQKRKDNQDRFLIAHDLKLVAVADGMGGHRGGEVAAGLAVETLERALRDAHPPHRDEAAQTLGRIIEDASAVIHARGHGDPLLDGMGTTTSALWLKGRRAHIAHVGDSRIYLLREGRIAQVTHDHSIVFEQVRAGLITAEQARHSPFRNVISRAVGVEARVQPDVFSFDLQSGDKLVLCSDGLSGLVEDAEIGEIVRVQPPYSAPKVLVDLANARGGTDNITAVVACAVETAAPEATRSAPA